MKLTMEKELIKLFCGLQNKTNLYSENKTLLGLYSAFNILFVIIVSLLDYYKLKNAIILIFPLMFLVLNILFLLWMLKNKNNTSFRNYFTFQGSVTLAISLIWIYLSIINIYSRQLGFSLAYVFGGGIGSIFSVIFLILRKNKWNNCKQGRYKNINKIFNAKAVSISTIILLASSCLSKNIPKIILYRVLSGLFIVLFFVFVTVSINSFVSAHIIFKYYMVDTYSR